MLVRPGLSHDARPVEPDLPVLMVLRQGRVLLRDRPGSTPQAYGPGWATVDPMAADFASERWSSDAHAQYGALEIDPVQCSALLDRKTPWELAGGRPFRFSDAKVTWWVDEIVGHCANGEPHGSLYTASASAALMAYLVSLIGGGTPALARPGRLPPQAVRKVKEHVEANLAQAIDLQELARLCGCSAGYLNRAFRASMGVPIHQFVIQQRVEHAKALLSQDTLPLAEIAVACGFANQAHFSTTFRRLAGCTPGEFRRQAKTLY